MTEEKEKSKNVEEITKLAQSFVFNTIKKKLETVVAVTRNAKGWKVVVELLERKSIPDTQDIVGRYEFELSSTGNVIGYKQIMLRHRSETIIEEEK